MPANAQNAQTTGTAKDFYNEGVKLKNSKNYKEALTAFKNAITKKADYEDAIYEAGWCCNELEKYAEAVTYLEKAAKLSPSAAKIFYELGYAYENTKKENDAIVNYKKALELYPEYYDASKNIGDIYYKKADYKTALVYMEQYLKADDADNYHYYKAGWCCNDLEKYKDAITYMEKYEPEDDNDKAKKFAEIGFANYKLENNDKAIEAYKNAISFKPDYGVALRGLGNVYYNNTKEYPQAIKYFELAMSKDEENSKTYYYDLGWLYNDAEKYTDAIKVLLKAIIYDAKDAGAREELGYAYFIQGDNTNALIQLNKAIELDPKAKLGYYYKGLTYLALNKKDDAREVYDKLKTVNAEQAAKLLAKINGK
jgi:tetratricopeptide (TPR) repeat protein